LIYPLSAQQTRGGITGEITDATGGAIPKAMVMAIDEQRSLTRTAHSNEFGVYAFVDLPIGSYTLSFTAVGFEVQKTQHITVQADRTATVNAALHIGRADVTVEVESSPLLNAVDTTNGYVLDDAQIQQTPLATGSFTGLAILSTGVSAELSGGAGVNSGLGNAPIWANGQRDTSNSFLLNGVDASNLFNGKSTSQVSSARIVYSTSAGNSNSGGEIQSSASVYLSIGNAIPSPAPEMLDEVRVNSSMYDAQQGANSGAHLDMSTRTGSNARHGNVYLHRGTNWLNAAPFFFNQDGDIPANQKVPQLHRVSVGGSMGGALIKDKLFAFAGYQHLHVSDQEIGYSRFSAPVGLSDDRSASALTSIAKTSWGNDDGRCPLNNSGCLVALNLFQQSALPGESGKWLIPNPTGVASVSHPYNVSLPGTAYFFADQLVSDVDWNASAKDTLALKYYYQHDPTIAPYAYSNVPGFAQHLDAGSQLASINNVNLPRANFSVTETLGFVREKIYSTNEQPFSPSGIGVNTFGSSYYPGVSIVDILGSNTPAGTEELNIGPGSNQGSFTGVFQNRWMPAANLIWTLGKHTLALGGNWSHTQLNPRDMRPGFAGIATSADFSQFLQGLVTTNENFQSTTFLQGNGNRYYRANQTSLYLQDKYQPLAHLSLTAGLRYDLDGGFSEKYGRLFNFDPSLFNAGTADDPTNPGGSIVNNGYVVAANNRDTTLLGKQWGIAPRLGFAWLPARFNNRVVIRGGTGFYYDRGELYAYLSPGAAAGEVQSGPFGVSQSEPFVRAQTCSQATLSYYMGYIPTCDPAEANLAQPWGASLGTAPAGKASDITQYLPNAYAVANGAVPFIMAVYDRHNTLPYSINYTLDAQWQPRNDVAIEIGYVGNVGRHQVMPLPLNQANIASPSGPIRNQNYTYGYTVTDANQNPIQLPDSSSFLSTYEGGNVDLRVPYIGYSSESMDYKTAGISMYNSLQVHGYKRLSHGLQAGASYTFSHTTDEQSAMGLFYNGNNPNNLRSGYGLADFDRKHVLNFTYSYRIPGIGSGDARHKLLVNGWSVNGITILQSGQPYSVTDYTGAVGSIYYSVFNGVTSPIVPLAPGCTPKNATTGASGAFGANDLALKDSCFTTPLLNPGDLNGAIPAGDLYETNFVSSGQRNIFRQAPQRRADISLVKLTSIREHTLLRYTIDVFNLTNTTSFDVPENSTYQNKFYNNFPVEGTTPKPTSCDNTNQGFYNCAQGLGATLHTIGGPRQIQMSIHLEF
jgi:hypothetical protein